MRRRRDVDALGQHGSFLAAAERVDVDRQRLDGAVVEPAGPGRHHAAAAVPDAFDDRRLVGAIEPDRVGQVGRAELAVALAVVAMTDGAIVGEDLLAGREIGAWRRPAGRTSERT